MMAKIEDRAFRDERRRDDLLDFKWTYHARAARPYVSPGRALSIMRIFARENLVRHLVFKEGASEALRGLDVDLESRVAVAARPALAGLMPLIVRYPLWLASVDGIGGKDGSVWLIDQSFRFGKLAGELAQLDR